MKCSNCGNDLEENAKFCKECGTKVENVEEKVANISTKKSKKNIYIFTILIIAIISIILVVLFIPKNNENADKKLEQTSANIQNHGAYNISFENMKNDKEDYTDKQRIILDYFDNDYFNIDYNCEELNRIPQVFKNAKVRTHISVKKLLKSDDNEYVIIGYICNAIYGDYDKRLLEDIDLSQLIVIKGKQLDKRLLENDEVDVYGKYIDTDTYNVDGKQYILPTVSVLKIVRNNYDFDTINIIAKSIFGDNIKLSTPELGQDYNDPYGIYGTENPDQLYLITLDNQSNSNFKYFDIYTNRSNICYDPKYNDIPKDTVKRLFISSDFEHFIVTTFDNVLNHVYIEYYDKQYNKMWTREFTCKSDIKNTGPMDYTVDKMAVVVDNDLYLIDLENGKNIIEPIIVSSSIQRVNMMKDGILLIGSDSKDTIMKVNYNGEIVYRNNVSLTNYNVYGMYMQVVNDKIVVLYNIYNKDYLVNDNTRFKYVILNSDGKIELEY